MDELASAEQMRVWGRGAEGTARRYLQAGDRYSADLASARSRVYVEAADLVTEHGEADAAKLMLDHAGRLRVDTPPLINFDEAGLSYVRARAWQHCAHYLTPDAPTVQAAWSGRGAP